LPTLTKTPLDLFKNNQNIGQYFSEAYLNIDMTYLFNLVGLPAMTIDFMKNQKDKYCPVMIIAKHFDDHRLIQFTRFIESFNI
jgi:Asp-tRNA(Asn)/Glu-tRNA(Gln) amidotransferase A subunit family amidase